MIESWEKAKEYLEQINDQDTQKNMGHLLNNLGMAYFILFLISLRELFV